MISILDSSCCGSVLPTVILEYFQSTIHEAMRFEVRNSLTASQVRFTIIEV